MQLFLQQLFCWRHLLRTKKEMTQQNVQSTHKSLYLRNTISQILQGERAWIFTEVCKISQSWTENDERKSIVVVGLHIDLSTDVKIRTLSFGKLLRSCISQSKSALQSNVIFMVWDDNIKVLTNKKDNVLAKFESFYYCSQLFTYIHNNVIMID